MRDLSIPRKLAVMLALPFAGVLTLSALNLWRDVHRGIELQRSTEIVELSIGAEALAAELQEERGLSGGSVEAGGDLLRSQLQAQRLEVDGAVARFRDVVAATSAEIVTGELANVIADVEVKLGVIDKHRAIIDGGSVTFEAATDHYSALVDGLHDVISAGARSCPDPRVRGRLASYHSMARALDRMGLERALVTNVLSNDAFAPGQYSQYSSLSSGMESFLEGFLASVDLQTRARFQETMEGASVDEVDRIEDILDQRAGVGGFGVEPAKWFDEKTRVIAEFRGIAARLSADMLREAHEYQAAGRRAMVIDTTLCLTVMLLATLLAATVSRSIVRPLNELGAATRRMVDGDLDVSIERHSADELGDFAESFDRMAKSLRVNTEEIERQNWLKTELGRLSAESQGHKDLPTLARTVITELSKLLHVGQGACYVISDADEGDEPMLTLLGTYAHLERKHVSSEVRFGEGLVGQCALERETILLTEVPSDYIRIQSGLGAGTPLNVLVAPVTRDGEVLGVIELASFRAFTATERELVDQLSSNLGVIMDSVRGRQRTEQLLQDAQRMNEELQTQSEELQSQQEELRTTNEELEEQARVLEESQARMERQSQELQASNEALERQKSALEGAKARIEASKREVDRKAREVETASRYKSEFLANMSHELRTPLNSLLILSRSLAEDNAENLTEEQVQCARVIHAGGQDLLSLINDILDLSKVEAGKLDVQPQEVPLEQLCKRLETSFAPVAAQRKVPLQVSIEDGVPAKLVTDPQRIEQIVKNLLSNAFKFTTKGSVKLRCHVPAPEEVPEALRGEPVVALAVIDTGIGIPAEKQPEVFEAFQQADGSTSRKFGGTGLGLTISRKLAHLLGGELHVRSAVGQGSTFTLFLPVQGAAAEAAQAAPPAAMPAATAPPREARPRPVTSSADSRWWTAGAQSPALGGEESEPDEEVFLEDDRDQVAQGERSVLIVEDDPRFAEILRDLARGKGYKALVAGSARSGLRLAVVHSPSAILLDLGLPDFDGLHVLDALKQDFATRHIPVHVISGRENDMAPLERGALGYLTKPVTKESLEQMFGRVETVLDSQVRKLLVVEDDPATQIAIAKLIKAADIEITEAKSGADALELMRSREFDCAILDLHLGDMNGLEVLRRMAEDEARPAPPVVVYTGAELSREQHHELRQHSSSIVVKGASSPERLLDEVSLFLHSVESSLPEDQRRMIRSVHDKDQALVGKRVLLVDDDLRNTFALSKVLRQHGLEVVLADNGELALEKLRGEEVDLVLMDIMMPVMDGYEAMRHIRAEPRYRDLPIIALTAKAMPEDRARCIEAGANDYLTKPVSIDQLLAMARIWLFQAQ